MSEPAACIDVQKKQVEGKFSGPFSIEALLKRDQPSPQKQQEEQQQQSFSRAAGVERNMSWAFGDSLLLQTSTGFSPLCPLGGKQTTNLGLQLDACFHSGLILHQHLHSCGSSFFHQSTQQRHHLLCARIDPQCTLFLPVMFMYLHNNPS